MALEAPPGLERSGTSIARGGRGPPVIKAMYILSQEKMDIFSGRPSMRHASFIQPFIWRFFNWIICRGSRSPHGLKYVCGSRARQKAREEHVAPWWVRKAAWNICSSFFPKPCGTYGPNCEKMTVRLRQTQKDSRCTKRRGWIPGQPFCSKEPLSSAIYSTPHLQHITAAVICATGLFRQSC